MALRRVSPPGWPAQVLLAYSTRDGGVSDGRYASFNLATHVGDCPDAVAINRSRLMALLNPDARIAWLQQVHGTAIVDAGGSVNAPATADGSWTTEEGIACAVLTADCLPIVLVDREGDVIAAIHAGWRGLAAGIIDEAIRVLSRDPGSLLAWLGPCIGPDAFEVGQEVMEAFLATAHAPSIPACSRPSPHREGHHLLDLQALATARLKARGVSAITAERRCTVSDAAQFYSYRRDGETGRMVTLVQRLGRSS